VGARGSTRGLLVWLGLIAYAVYNYAFYLFGAALNVFFPFYVLAFVVCRRGVDTRALTARCRRRGSQLWSGDSRACDGRFAHLHRRWAGGGLDRDVGRTCLANRPTPVDPEAFKIVAALDLALMVPALTAGGVLLWRRRPWGYVIAALASIQGALYLLVLSVNSVVAIRRGLASAPGELPIWGTLLVVTTVIALVLLASIQRERVVSP